MVEKTYDITYETSFGGDYPDRLQSYAGEKLKLFFVPSVKHGREIVEFIRRTGVAYETVTIDRAWDLNKWGIGDYYDIRASVDDQHIMFDNLEKVLTSEEHFDVLVIPAVNGWSHFTAAAREAIVRRVKAGAGLVLMRPFHGEDKLKSPELEELSPLVNLFEEGFAVDNNAGEGYPKVRFDLLKSGRWTAAKSHYITSGIPLELLPCEELAYYPYQAAGDVLIEAADGSPIAAVKSCGKGRVVAFGYYPRDILPQHKEFTGKESTYDAVIDRWAGAKSSCTFAFLESFYELVYRSVIWAAKRETDCLIEPPVRKEQEWDVRTSGSLVPDRIQYTIKNAYDEIVAEGNCDGSVLPLPRQLENGGEFRVALNAFAAGELVDFATFGFSQPLQASIAEAVLSHQSLQVGETLQVMLRLEGLAAGELSVQIIDDYGNVLQQSVTAFKSGSDRLTQEFRAAAMKSMHITVQADVRIGNHLVQRWTSERIVVTPSQRQIEDFEVFTAPQNRGHGDFLGLVGERYHEIGITGLFPGSSKTLTMSGAEGLGVYWYHRGPYVERKEQYYRTKDKEYLVRIPCLNDPAFWQGLQHKITGKVAEFKHFGPIAYFANDEGSLTCYTDELDLCFCSHCLGEMREWLKQDYASDIEALNLSWGTAYSSWNEAFPLTREEARRRSSYAPWADHRRFMENTFIEAYRRIASIVKSEDEGGVIRMSGCQASTAYSGYDYYRLHQHVGYFEAYGVGNQYEFHRSFAKPGTIIGGWFGYGVDGATAKHGVWHGVYHGLTLCNIFWEFSMLNPDYSLSNSAKDLSVPFKEIREEGIGKLLLHVAERDHCGIAIHYSMASVRGTTIAADRARFESNRQGWIDMLEDSGYQYSFVATQQIEAGELLKNDYKLLVLPYSIALSAAETAEITRFVQQGGVIIGDIQTGLMDKHCTPLSQGQLDELFGIERLSTEAEPFYNNDGFVPNADFNYFVPDESFQDVRIAEFGIRSRDGQPAYRDDFMRKIAAVNIRQYGEGKAIYLNLALAEYTKLRRQSNGGSALRELIGHVIGLSEASKPAELTQLNGQAVHAGYESFYYTNGNAAYVAVLRKLSDVQSLGHDGLAVGGGKKEEAEASMLRFQFANYAHVYDIRERRYLGYTDHAEFSLAEGDTKLISLLPCQVTDLGVTANGEWKRGATEQISFALETNPLAEPDFESVISIHISAPDGSRDWLYSDNIRLARTNYVHEVAVPYNARTGIWTVTAKDTATGISTQFEVTIV
ncbi:beta-galactosidase trimerization domain-containing protein [Paenibacillus sp. CF384]|uniref:beta-galactosidase trimerization domain-containing protein n=1 Tax=Paenibacillus sp. CF384 TaxID=1884382 RepID=UPI00089BB401|nr:beta-galactosidase trimerization domain-containing protein [Paenibacillus sp. CF384]SDW17320.1 Beta-galactosidase [Paenibacillus sp. CF384]